MNFAHKLIILLFLFVSVTQVSGQYKELKFRRISKKEGLSSSNVTCFTQTPDGLLWIGTSDGLNVYDGYNFKIFKNNPSDQNSISDNSITTLFVDHTGTLWIGTENSGLNRYNPKTKSFTSYKRDLYDQKTISNNYITNIIQDSDNNLWVGTMRGLNRFHFETEDFTRYFHELGILVENEMLENLKQTKIPPDLLKAVSLLNTKEFSNERSFYRALGNFVSKEVIEANKELLLRFAKLKNVAQQITALQPDNDGNIWIAFEKDGLTHFNPVTNSLRLFSRLGVENFSSKLNEAFISSLMFDHKMLWIGTREGELYEYQIEKKKLSKLCLPESNNPIASIYIDQKKILWVGNDYGLYRYNRKEDHFVQYENVENDLYSLSTTAVKAIFEDEQRNLWIGCAQGGINLTVTDIIFEHYKHHTNSFEGLSKNSISSILEDREGNIWIGYYTMGIDLWNQSTGEITHYAHSPQDAFSLGKGSVFEIFEDNEGLIWVGTYEGGLQQLDKKSQNFITYKNDPASSNSISGNDVRSITEDENGLLWLAIHGKGVNSFDKKTKQVKRYTSNNVDWENSLANEWVYQVFVDSQQNIWAGTVFGFSILYQGSDHFITYNNENSNLSHNSVRVIMEDSKNRIWLGTENGLNLFDKEKNQIKVWQERDGLPNNKIHGIVEDEQNNLWISTNNGITRFETVQENFVNYGILDGLQSYEFFPGAYAKGNSGAIYFGGANGLNILYPDKIRVDQHDLPMLISEVKIYDQAISHTLLKNAKQTQQDIVLDHDQNYLTFNYVAINYKNPDKIQYAYMLEGLDRTWNYVRNQQSATYSNLGAGSYTFKVKAATNEGIWSDQIQQLAIKITPPYWKTPIAYIIYAAIIAILLYFFKRLTLSKERLKNALELQQLEARKTHEIDQMKLNFFTNISHELRTPLTLIIDPINTLIAKNEHLTSNKRKEYYHLVSKNTQRLLRLINQLLDSSEIDAGFIKLAVVKQDIVGFCENISNAFSYHADHLNIDFSFDANIDYEEVYFDQDKLEKILFNLISNAFKFTHEHGYVSVKLKLVKGNDPDIPSTLQNKISSNANCIALSVEDNGIGIKENYKEHIFKRFYQVEKKEGNVKGTGIGLALAKQLAECHHGEITLASKEGRGSKFTVWLPVSKECFATNEFGKEGYNINAKVDDIKAIYNTYETTRESISEREGVSTKERPKILLVEDSEDVRNYLYDHLKDYYRIDEASDGKIAFGKIIASNPDIVLSDVMMPIVNGFELCKMVKQDTRTSHIPVLLLTARSSENYEYEGLQSGADDYITKPFQMKMLELKISNILNSRRKLKERLHSDFNFEPKKITTNPIDEEFMTQLLEAIESKIDDENLNPDVLAEMMHMSRSQLYKKIKGLTGLSVSIFIRNIRIRKGYELLKSSSMNVSEVAYNVGFSDPGYFTKCFRKMYAKSPTDIFSSSI